MLTAAQLLEGLARHRTDEVVVTTMSSARPWGHLSDHALDFASIDSAMGHGADLALGIALLISTVVRQGWTSAKYSAVRSPMR